MTNQPGEFPPPTGLPVIAGQGPTAAARRPLWGRILLWGGIALMVIGVVGAVGDWASRTWEMNQLLSRIEGSEQAMQIAKDSIGAVTLPPDADPAAEGRGHPATGDRERRRRATRWRPRATRWPRCGSCRGTASSIQAQSAYLSHNAAWADYLDRGASEPLTLFGDDNRIEPTWARPRPPSGPASPLPALPMITSRVDQIFTDDERRT